MVEGVAAAPVDEADARVRQPAAVEVVGLTGLEQHVREAGERDDGAHRIRELRQGRRVAPLRRAADVPERAVAAAESAAGEADLAQHRGEGHHHPRRLLAMLDALERPVRVDQGPLRRHPPGEAADRSGRDAGEPLGPLGCLRHAVLAAAEIGLEAVEARAVAAEERSVAEPLVDQGVGEAEHDGDVRARHDRQPLGADELGHVVADRAHQHELRAARLRRPEVVPQGMPARAAGAHHRVLQRDAAEADEQLGVALDQRPRGGPVEEAPHVAHDVGHDHGQGAVAVAVLAADEAAEAIEEAMELALRVVEAARAGPAVRAAVDALAAVGVVDAAELARQELDRRRPAHRHERLGAPATVRSRPAVEPSGPDHGPVDARPVPQAPGNVAEERRRVGIGPVGVNGHDGAALDFRLEGAPVRCVETKLGRHVGSS